VFKIAAGRHPLAAREFATWSTATAMAMAYGFGADSVYQVPVPSWWRRLLVKLGVARVPSAR
jgi:hypothetical protein